MGGPNEHEYEGARAPESSRPALLQRDRRRVGTGHARAAAPAAAAEQVDIFESCRKAIAAEGLTITTAKGAVKENPAVCTMRQATRLIQSLVRQMDLTEDAEPSYKGRVRPHRHRRGGSNV